MKKLAMLMLLSGCATTYSAGGHVTDGCREVRVTDARADGFKVYACLRPFPSQARTLRGEACPSEAWAWRSVHGPTVPCGWTAGFTDKATREIFFYEVMGTEVLEHELQHAAGQIADWR